jgi:hypothetical protein
MSKADKVEFRSLICPVSRVSVVKRVVWHYHEARLVLFDGQVLAVFHVAFSALSQTSQQYFSAVTVSPGFRKEYWITPAADHQTEIINLLMQLWLWEVLQHFIIMKPL